MFTKKGCFCQLNDQVLFNLLVTDVINYIYAHVASVNDEALVDADEIAAHPGVEDEISDTRRHSMDSPSTAK